MGEELYPCDSGSRVHVTNNGDGYVLVTADGGDGELYVPDAEWSAFVELIRAGERR